MAVVFESFKNFYYNIFKIGDKKTITITVATKKKSIFGVLKWVEKQKILEKT